jgi:hypothetical protein
MIILEAVILVLFIVYVVLSFGLLVHLNKKIRLAEDDLQYWKEHAYKYLSERDEALKKIKHSGNVIEILRDIQQGGAVLEVIRVDKNDIFFHNGSVNR